MTDNDADAGATEQDARALGAHLQGMYITPSRLQQMLEREDDIFIYGLPHVRALQEMAQTTPYSRQQWIEAWTRSRTYRRALDRREIPDLAAWLASVRHLAADHPLDAAIWGADTINAWNTEVTAFMRLLALHQLTVTLGNAAGAVAALWYAIDPKRCHHNPACFCRPAPNPAARDYHRRAKHRRRRQR